MRKRSNAISGMLMALMASAGPALANPAAGELPNPRVSWNHAWNEVLIDLWVIGIVFGIIAVYMLIKYRAKSPGDVGTAQPMNLDKALAWSLVPAALFMADDFLLAAKGWSLWNIQRQVPPNALEIKVNAEQWAFSFDYGNGITDDAELVVPVGRPVVLRMTSKDVIHSFGLNHYRVKEDIMPGRITYIWFLPDEPLESKVVCVEFCGMAHSQMNSTVRAVEQAAYDEWMAKKVEKAAKKKTSSLENNNKVAELAAASAAQ
jgi:cytochrome c oxidase subunit II